ncbi:guanine deaminase [Oceanobacter kriegii]|uniref:guanine deaminase n=1 Tax=Oceanobacter kriegii TaxID=64972 RepID=UPI0006852BDB|nr:guanine deaminase [Oceanobacter kriegii]
MTTAFRGTLLYFTDDPLSSGKSAEGGDAVHHIQDGLLLVGEGGFIERVGEYSELIGELPFGVEVVDHSGKILMPGFVDCHIHYPQTEMIAAYGTQLLDWLETHTFPVESKFKDYDYGVKIAERFCTELLRNGTTTALVFGSVHPESVDAFFTVAQQRKLRMIAGKVMMDRHAPDTVLDTAETSYTESKALIEKWHGKDRLDYAVTPRFAPTSTPEQLQLAGRLLEEFPGVYLHTHLSENKDEIAWVKQLFPDSEHYLDVYDQAGLLGKRSVFAHGIHLCDDECQRMADSDSVVAHCPSSNLFLGSGLFDLQKMDDYGIRVGIGSDVGGGSSFSAFDSLADAYKIQQLRDVNLDPFRALYLATLGGAKALSLDDRIGSFKPGMEADFIVLDPKATDFLAFRTQHCKSLKELLFVLNTLGDDRVVNATYILGELAHTTDMIVDAEQASEGAY